MTVTSICASSSKFGFDEKISMGNWIRKKRRIYVWSKAVQIIKYRWVLGRIGKKPFHVCGWSLLSRTLNFLLSSMAKFVEEGSSYFKSTPLSFVLTSFHVWKIPILFRK